MMSAPHSTSPPTRTAHSGRLRLALKSELSGRGHVDGGWWPHSRDLQAELPDLIEAMCDRLGPVETVTYHLEDWAVPPRRIVQDGAAVRLGGYRLQAHGSVDIIARKQRATLLVVDPDTSEQLARATLTAASDEGNTETIPALLAHARADENTTRR
jgi:hypothetical protein